MKAPTTREERKLRDADFKRREQPRLLWDSQRQGTYRAKVKQPQEVRQPTEAEVNAAARAVRRRQNKRLRGWRPYAQR